jgi:uncharacterized radical SAM superfamily Fe-S cluster-containing enzyme
LITCAALYNHTNIRGNNRVFPCCRYKTPLQTFDGDVNNILHSDEYVQLRKNFSINDPNCAKCKNEEEIGKPSLREWFNKTYNNSVVQLRYLEIGFDNICDLTCDGCWEEWSHSWYVKKNPAANPKDGITSTTELRNIPESTEKVVFLGGEPLMTNRHRKFLKSFDTLDYLTVEYFTNGMHHLRKEDIELLNKCKHVHFTISIDAYGMLNNQVRRGSDWNVVVSTVEQIAKQFDYTIHTTIHKNNWHGLLDIYNWTQSINATWTTNILTFPKELDIVNLSLIDKKKLLSMNFPGQKYIKKHLKNEIR